MQRRDTLLNDRLSGLIGHFYDAAVDSRLWSDVRRQHQ
jgi:hypothetical protein